MKTTIIKKNEIEYPCLKIKEGSGIVIFCLSENEGFIIFVPDEVKLAYSLGEKVNALEEAKLYTGIVSLEN
jgi:hypothetical protein